MKAFLSPLSQEEEKECLQKLKLGDEKAKEELILHNMRLVAHVAKKYQNEDDDFQINAQFTIDLIKKKESWNFGNYIKFSTCDVSSFLNAFCKGSELTFVFNDLNQMIIDKLLDKELFHFKVQHLFNPIIDNY